MDFDRSTQARSWIFDENTLSLCREKILSDRSKARKSGGGSRVRKFAAGFHRAARRHDEDRDSRISASNSPILGVRSKKRDFFEPLWSQSTLTTTEQDVLVRFHAHQITMLTGPQAVLPELRRSQTVLATAIMFFRRFYLSNSVLDFSPRRMAVAAAFLAAKVEENRVEIELLEHATELIFDRMNSAPLCRNELAVVSIEEIEAAERDLMEGINYEMRCHHPFGAVRVLTGEVANFLSKLRKSQNRSPRSPLGHCDLRERSLTVAQNALLFSDAPFLFPPGQIAFASVAMCMQGDGDCLGLPRTLRAYLRTRFTTKTEEELHNFEDQVSAIVDRLADSPVIHVGALSLSRSAIFCDDEVARQADELRRVFFKVSGIRSSQTTSPRSIVRGKRKFVSDYTISPVGRDCIKVAKVTPTKL